MSSLNALFSTPFYKSVLGFEHREDLKRFLLSCETDEFRHQNSPQTAHRQVFESQFDFLNWKQDIVGEFKRYLYDHLMKYLIDVNGFTQSEIEKLTFKNESWFHITRSGGYFQPHTHPLASVSIVYCVDPGDLDISNQREAGQIMFYDPRHNASMYIDPANRHMKRLFSFDGLRFRFKADEICIFPSYLQHSVEPYIGESPRITIAANFSFNLK